MKQNEIRAMVKLAGGKVSVETLCKNVPFRTPYFIFTLTLPGTGQVRSRDYSFTFNGSDKEAGWLAFETNKLRPLLRRTLIHELSERTTASDLEHNMKIVQEFESGNVNAWKAVGSVSVRLMSMANALLHNPIQDPPNGLIPIE